MGRSSSPHAQFFTSLRRLEKRLKLEDRQSPPPEPAPEAQEIVNGGESTDSLGTPIYLAVNHSAANTNFSDLQESETPREFLSNFSPTTRNLPQENQPDARRTIDDEIEQLMKLLGLPDSDEPNDKDLAGDDGFYRKIVQMKGPICASEADRLDRWIKLHLKGEKTEPLRLAHLLLGKAAFVHLGNDTDGFGGLVFPSTIDEFLQNDPPTK